jgi:hypothetical protein
MGSIVFSLPFPVHSEEDTEQKNVNDILTHTLKPGEIFNCNSHIFYHWSPKSETNTESVDKDSQNKEPLIIKEYFKTLSERGKQGLATKHELEKRVDQSKSEAFKTCRKNHSSSHCETSKLKAIGSQIQLMDFQTKRDMKKSIQNSCEEVSGTCIEVTHSDIQCDIYSSPDTPTTLEKTSEPETKKTK